MFYFYSKKVYFSNEIGLFRLLYSNIKCIKIILKRFNINLLLFRECNVQQFECLFSLFILVLGIRVHIFTLKTMKEIVGCLQPSCLQCMQWMQRKRTQIINQSKMDIHGGGYRKWLVNIRTGWVYRGEWWWRRVDLYSGEWMCGKTDVDTENGTRYIFACRKRARKSVADNTDHPIRQDYGWTRIFHILLAYMIYF